MTDFNDPNATAARRLRLLDALRLNPDKRAEDRNIGIATGTPIGLVDDSIRRQYRVDQLDAQMQGLSVLPAAVRKSETFATLAQDDLETLASLEKVTKARQRRANAIAAAIRKANERGWASGIGTETWGNVRKIPSAIWANMNDKEIESLRYTMQVLDQQGKLTPEGRRGYEEDIRRHERQRDASLQKIRDINTDIAAVAPTVEPNIFQKMARSAVTSSPYSVGALAVSLATRNPFAGPAAMGYAVGETGQSEARMDGLDYNEAARKGAIDGVAEAAFEILPMAHMLTFFGRGAAKEAARTGGKEALKTFGKAAASDVIGENATQVVQDANNLFHGLDPEMQKAIDEHGLFSAEVLKIQGERQLIASGSSLITSVTLGGPRLVATMKQNHEADLTNLDAAAEAVRQSRTRERAPDVFDQYVRDLVEDSDVGDIYADGNALHQDGLDEALAEALPERAEEIRAAVENGGSVQIPLEDYLSRIAPNEELTNALRPHIRDADGMSAQELENHALGELEQDIRNEVTRLATEDARATEIQAIEQAVLEQLNAAGQTTEEANRTYATLYAASVDTLSRRMGISPQAYQAQYGVNIANGQGVTNNPTAQNSAGNAPQAGQQDAGAANNTQDIDTEVASEAASQMAAGAEAAVQNEQQNSGQQRNTAAEGRRMQDIIKADNIRLLREQVAQLGTAEFDARIDDLEKDYVLATHETLALDIINWAKTNGFTFRRTGKLAGDFEWVKEGQGNNAPNIPASSEVRQIADTHTAALIRTLRKQAGELGTTDFDARIDALEAQYDGQAADNLINDIHAYARANGYTAQRTGTGGAGQFAWVKENPQASSQNSYQQALAEHPPKGWAAIDSGQDVHQLWAGEGINTVFWADLQGKLQMDAPVLNGYSHSLSRDAANHIHRQHGNPKTEAARGQIAITRQLYERIPDIVTDYDAMRSDFVSEDGFNTPRIAYVKRFDDGVVIYIEQLNRKKKDLQAVSMRMYPPTTNAARVLANVAPPGLNALDGLGAYSNHTPTNGGTQGGYQQATPTPRGAFSPDNNTITLTPNADLSTFIHELGHYFLETLTRHASELRARNDAGVDLTDGQKQIIRDADAMLAQLGVSDLDTWHRMTVEEKRSHHELAARQFETYVLEGKAPSLELQGAFQRFRAWLLRIYKAARNLNAPLNDEVRQIFDRLLASDEAIELAEQNRSMMQLFENAEEAGMTPEQFAAYQQQGRDATQAAQDEMQTRALRDTRYIRSLRNKALRRKQQEAKAARQQAEMQARQIVLGQPVYRVWQFLSGTMTADTTIASNRRAWTDAVDPTHDDLNTAIAKLGGLNRDAVEQEWGLDPADRIPDIRPGFPVLRRNGGLSVDGMRQALVEQGYLNDRDSLNDFYAIFAAQQRGQTQYSHQHQPDPGSGKAGENAHLHDLPTLRLDREALLNLGYSEAQIKQLGRKVRKTGGVHPDLVAELFQDEDGNALYDSGDALVQALLAAKRPQDAINDVADDIMLQQFGELATPQAVAFAADMAVHNDIRLRVIASEANALAKAVGNKTLLNRAARQLAQETIAAKRLRDIHPAQYTRMEARAAKAAALAQKKGDIATAAAEKRNQLLQAHLARAAYEAQEEAATHLRYLKRMSRLNPKNIDIKQREQIEAILERYNLRDQSKKAIDRSQTLAQWVEAQRKQGIEVNIDPKVLDEANRTPWQHLSLTDLRGLRDSIKQIEHQGRLKNTLLLNRKNRDYNATVASLVDGLKQHASRSGIENRTPTTTFGRAGAQLRRFFTAHLRTAMIARRMDGDRDGGAWWDNLIRPANERADWQTSENARATEALARILAPLIAQKGLNQKRSYQIGGKTRSFTLQDIFVMGLNYGNDSNAQRLLGGENWQATEFEQLLSQLNAEQLNALQGVWDTFEQYKPQIAEVTRRVLGIEPEWIAPRPFTITSADGQVVNLRGGYYPVMYDPRASAVAADQELHNMESGAYSAAVINRGFLKSRVAEVHNRPLLYNMAGVYRGLNNVIHYLAWYEWQLDSNRLLNSKRVSDAIRDHYGDDVYRQFKSWARDIAVGDLQIESEGVALVNAVRRNAGVAGLGFNIISALKQPLGLFQSVGRVGGQHILPQLGRWMIHARQMTREAKAQSAFMQNRARTRFRELNELAASLSQKNKLQTFLARHSYTMIMFVQMQVDVITWHAQQQKSLEAGASIEEANRHADQAVIDSQGSGMLKDLSAAERGQIMKLFTIYYGFMNTIMNLNYNTLTSTRQGKIEKAVNLTVLLAIAPILEAALSDLLKPGDSDRWDKENAAKTMAIAMMNNLFGQFIILREFNLSGYDYSGPVGLRAIADAYKLRDEIKQGEWDSGLRRAAIGIGGSAFGLPAAQINRTLDGLQALDDGDTDNPLAVLLGKPQQ